MCLLVNICKRISIHTKRLAVGTSIEQSCPKRERSNNIYRLYKHSIKTYPLAFMKDNRQQVGRINLSPPPAAEFLWLKISRLSVTCEETLIVEKVEIVLTCVYENHGRTTMMDSGLLPEGQLTQSLSSIIRSAVRYNFLLVALSTQSLG